MEIESITDEQITAIEAIIPSLANEAEAENYSALIARIRADAKTIKELEDYKWMYEDLCK